MYYLLEEFYRNIYGAIEGMRILYITSSFDKIGSASVRNIGLVNGLLNNGCEVDVLTQYWPDSMVDVSLKKYQDNRTCIYRDSIPIINRYFSSTQMSSTVKKKNKIARFIVELAKQIYFFPDIDKEWIRIYKKNLDYKNYDLIISSSDTKTAHFIANSIKKEYRTPWFSYWGDPWKDDMGTKGIKKILASIYEKKFIRNSDAIFYTSIPTITAIKNTFGNLENIYYLPRGYLEQIVEKPAESNTIRLLYPGSIYYGRNISNLIEQIKYHNEKKRIKIQLDIYGYCDDRLKEIYQSKYVIFHNQVDFSMINNVIAKSDGLIILMNDANSHQIPGKLYDFFGTNKMIVAIMPGKNQEVEKFLKNTGRCLVYESRDINLEEIIENVHSECWRPLEDYDPNVIAKSLLEVYDKIK